MYAGEAHLSIRDFRYLCEDFGGKELRGACSPHRKIGRRVRPDPCAPVRNEAYWLSYFFSAGFAASTFTPATALCAPIASSWQISVTF